MNRREAISLFTMTSAAWALVPFAEAEHLPPPTNQNFSPDPNNTQRTAMTITCFIRYQIDPFQREDFKRYAEAWGRLIPRCGGHLIGYFLPLEGTNDIAWGLIAFPSLAAYEAYRARLRSDSEAIANFSMAQCKRLILREERTFLELVDGTLALSPHTS